MGGVCGERQRTRVACRRPRARAGPASHAAGGRRSGLPSKKRGLSPLSLRTAVTALALAATTAPPAANAQPAAEPAHRRAARYARALLLARICEVFPPLWDLPDAGTGDFDPHAQPAPEYAFDQRLAW